MSIGFQPIAPLERDSEDGFGMIKNFKKNIRQNLKMLILTSPGERVMFPRFGVGMKNFLFESQSNEVFASIDSKIREQVSIYLPYIEVKRIKFNTDAKDNNKLFLTLTYSVPRISLNDVLTTEVL